MRLPEPSLYARAHTVACGGRGGARSAARPSPVPRFWTLLFVLLAVAEGAGPSPETVLAIRDGRKLADGSFQLDVASISTMIGSDCSAELPCWPAAGSSLLNVNDIHGVSLGSRDSLKLLRRQSYNLGLHQNLPTLRNSACVPDPARSRQVAERLPHACR